MQSEPRSGSADRVSSKTARNRSRLRGVRSFGAVITRAGDKVQMTGAVGTVESGGHERHGTSGRGSRPCKKRKDGAPHVSEWGKRNQGERLGHPPTTSVRTLYSSVAYAPYGEPYAQAGATDLSFTGQDQDTVSGLHDFMDRKYSPVQGRWLSPDPAGLGAVDMSNPQSWNRYAYVMNNPLALIDPLGDDAYEGCSPTATPWCYSSGYADIFGWDPFSLMFQSNLTCENGDCWFVGLCGMSACPPIIDLAPYSQPFPSDILNAPPVMPKLCTAHQDAIDRANAMWDTVIQPAADANDIDPALLAAVGIRETGFRNKWQDCNDTTVSCATADGAGIFQIDLGQPGNANVSVGEAFTPAWAANYAANMLSNNMNTLASKFPNFTAAQLTQATAASYNFGTKNISGNPSTIDQHTTGNNYGSSVVSMMGCF